MLVGLASIVPLVQTSSPLTAGSTTMGEDNADSKQVGKDNEKSKRAGRIVQGVEKQRRSSREREG